MEITLPSGRKIGDGHPPFVIAEVGSNWRDLNDCMTSISQAKACGADAVKFQLFTEKELYGFKTEVVFLKPGNPIKDKSSIGDRLKINHLSEVIPVETKVIGQLPPEWLPKLKEKADACGIEFMCTAFSPEGYELVDKYVNIHKVASAECTHKRILEKLRDIAKPVILSTGAHGVGDINAALSVLHQQLGVEHDKWPEVVLMYCVAAYPARVINLGVIDTLRKTFDDALVGYSDHSTDVLEIPLMAHVMGACVIEKHVQFVEGEFPDSPHSITGEELKLMIQSVNKRRDLSFGPTPEEKPMLLRHNRRLIAIKDIKEGETLTENENFGIYRSLQDDTHAFHPFMVDKVNGRIAKKNIKAGDGIGPRDV